jgi:DNA-binding LacI/PurR family transcriptional regulator
MTTRNFKVFYVDSPTTLKAKTINLSKEGGFKAAVTSLIDLEGARIVYFMMHPSTVYYCVETADFKLHIFKTDSDEYRGSIRLA